MIRLDAHRRFQMKHSIANKYSEHSLAEHGRPETERPALKREYPRVTGQLEIVYLKNSGDVVISQSLIIRIRECVFDGRRRENGRE